MKVTRALLGVLVLGLVFAAGFGLRMLVKTPDEAALPEPEPELVTAGVAPAVLTSVLNGSASIVSETPTSVNPPAPEGSLGVVTEVPVSAGDAVPFCGVLVEVSDRPVLALPGDIAPFRDIGVGDSGEDVRRLQQALRDCGYSIATDGSFGAVTAATVSALYRENDYSAPTREVESDPEASTVPSDGEEAAESTEPATPEPPKREVVVPISEIVFLENPSWVASTVALSATVGEEPLVEVSSGALHATVAFTAAERNALTGDETLVLTLEGEQHEFELPELPVAPTIDDEGEPTFRISITLPDGVSREVAGTEASWTITAGSEEEYPLAVPVTALHAAANGAETVHVLDADGTIEVVEVSQIASGGGYVALEGDLAAGDNVVVGAQ
ncbi:peptidoglycan-binding protein [Ruania alba]|uniref:Putative peptidoglycan binding domain-containing protein n=1 Tax=Ruania alba TaxID=648782 RepID=A0A1H5L0D6_9MICO|nr:peptidoglycan-binding protein [Ruania alba]SEE70552.1 Putative peptidoglycan binding domain-containing protein [Ruania alba]